MASYYRILYLLQLINKKLAHLVHGIESGISSFCFSFLLVLWGPNSVVLGQLRHLSVVLGVTRDTPSGSLQRNAVLRIKCWTSYLQGLCSSKWVQFWCCTVLSFNKYIMLDRSNCSIIQNILPWFIPPSSQLTGNHYLHSFAFPECYTAGIKQNVAFFRFFHLVICALRSFHDFIAHYLLVLNNHFMDVPHLFVHSLLKSILAVLHFENYE